MLILLINSAIVGLFAFVFCDILVQQGQALEHYGQMLEWLYQRGYRRTEKMLGGCGKCFSGQVALWTYPLWSTQLDYLPSYWIDPKAPPIGHWLHVQPWQYVFACYSYHPVGHIVAVCLSITSYIIISACLKKYT